MVVIITTLLCITGTNLLLLHVVQVPLMDIAGRRPLLIIPMAVMILDLVAMTICLTLQVR